MCHPHVWLDLYCKSESRSHFEQNLNKLLSYLRNEKRKYFYMDICTGQIFAIDVLILLLRGIWPNHKLV